MQEDNNTEENLQSAGELLKNTRMKQGKTLQDAADELCIRRFYLDAIENMDYNNFPPMPYSIGFVKSYAEYLGLNADRIVSAYKKEMFSESVDNNNHHYNNATQIKLNKKSSGPKFWHVLLGLVCLLLLVSAWLYNADFAKETKDVVESQEQENIVAEPEIIENEQDSAEDFDDEKINDSNDEIEQQTEEKKVETEEETVKEETVKEETPAEENASRIKIVLTGPSWIELKQGGKVLLTGVYQKGYSYEIPQGNNTIISVGRPRSVQFYVDGKLTRVATAVKPRNILLDKFLQK